MQKQTYTFTEAKAHLSELFDRVKAGEIIEVTRYGEVAAQIVPPQKKPVEKADWIGCMEGQMKLPEDWDSWPEDIARHLGMIE
jgi:prevent-host-death family protein